MRLPKPFYRLPLRLDVERLRAEVAALPSEAWVAHPNAIEGNSAIRLITANGGENDAVYGAMRATSYLERSPYIKQVLASFGVVWSRSRLMRLAPGATVPEHADINYHWFTRVRLHFPIATQPEVKFHCGDQTVHMAAGEAWLFDNWRLHSVENHTPHERIHLVADTTGSSSFWQFVAQSEAGNISLQQLQYDPHRAIKLLTEQAPPSIIMPPAEVDLLIIDLQHELTLTTEARERTTQLLRYRNVLEDFSRDWRQLYLLYGDGEEGWPEFTKLRDGLRERSKQLGDGIAMKTNRIAAHTVLQGRILQHAIRTPEIAQSTRIHGTRHSHSSAKRLSRPIFIVAAPRSGSTLLFETLAVTPQLHTLGGEAHWLVEGVSQLQPGAPGVESNRLTAAHCTDSIAQDILNTIFQRLKQSNGAPASIETQVRFLEKTPKNALRVPFFNKLFPDARFIFLWRDPRENLSSIMEAWRSGNWITYRGLRGWNGPWSLLLPPGWRSLKDKSLEEIAAFQWATTNRIVLDDLNALDRSRWTSLSYASLLADPEAAVRALCTFAEIEFDSALQTRVNQPLPLSQYTQTKPAADKWRINEAAIQRVLPEVLPTWERLQSL